VQNQNTAAFYIRRGKEKFKTRQYTAAIQDFHQAIQHDPNNTDVCFDRGLSFALEGWYDAAIHDFDTVIRFQPANYAAYYNRGLAKANLDQHLAAIQDFYQAIQFNPEYVRAYCSKSKANQILGNISEARTDLEAALTLATQDNDDILIKEIKKQLHLM